MRVHNVQRLDEVLVLQRVHKLVHDRRLPLQIALGVGRGHAARGVLRERIGQAGLVLGLVGAA